MSSKKKVLLISGIVLVVLAIAGVICWLVFSGDDEEEVTFEQNKKTLSIDMDEVPKDAFLYTNEEAGMAFWCPNSAETEFVEKEGVYVSFNGEQTPYILVTYSKERDMDPETYFAEVKRMVKKQFDQTKASEMKNVGIGRKELYKVTYTCETKEGDTYYLERFLELYSEGYVQYTVIEEEKKALEDEVEDIIKTLRLDAEAYEEESDGDDDSDSDTDTDSDTDSDSDSDTDSDTDSTAWKTYEHGDMNFAMKFAGDMDVTEMASGFYASSEDAMIFAIYSNTDSDGAMIYGLQDYIDRTQKDGLLKKQLAADYLDVGNGDMTEISGKTAVSLPMEIEIDGFSGTGKLYLISAETYGIYFVYYAVKDSASEELQNACANACETMDITKAPNTTEFQMYEDVKYRFGIAYPLNLLKGEYQDTGYGTCFYPDESDKTYGISIETLALSDFNLADCSGYANVYLELARKSYPDSNYQISNQETISTRYPFYYNRIQYESEGTPCCCDIYTMQMGDGKFWIISLIGTQTQVEGMNDLLGYVLWSFRLAD